MITIEAGTLLVSDPFLKDPNFARSVILVCEHEAEGSLGFVLNKLHNQKLGDLITDLEGVNFPVFYGGPVQIDTLHFLHHRPDIIEGGIPITDGIFWGGDFDKVVMLIQENKLPTSDIRFYIGYSGWAEGQLVNELTEKTWITHPATRKLIFGNKETLLWNTVLKEMGGEFAQLANYPIDPQLN